MSKEVENDIKKVETSPVDETVKMDAKPVEKPVEEPESGKKTIAQLVEEVVRGAHGTGRERMLSLGDQYEEVQHEVNQLIKKGEVK